MLNVDALGRNVAWYLDRAIRSPELRMLAALTLSSLYTRHLPEHLKLAPDNAPTTSTVALVSLAALSVVLGRTTIDVVKLFTVLTVALAVIKAKGTTDCESAKRIKAKQAELEEEERAQIMDDLSQALRKKEVGTGRVRRVR